MHWASSLGPRSSITESSSASLVGLLNRMCYHKNSLISGGILGGAGRKCLLIGLYFLQFSLALSMLFFTSGVRYLIMLSSCLLLCSLRSSKGFSNRTLSHNKT